MGINFHKAAIRRTLTMFFPEYQYEQTIIITLVGDEPLKTTETGLKTPGWQVLLKDSASVLNGVLGG